VPFNDINVLIIFSFSERKMIKKEKHNMVDVVLEDYTQSILDGDFPDPPTGIQSEIGMEQGLDPLELTVTILKRRPDIRKAVLEVLEDLIIPWEGDEEEPDDFIDNQLLIAIKLDPMVHATITECVLELGDCCDEEGEEMYYPSIFDTDDAQEIFRQIEAGGYREDKQHVPAKYAHLDDKDIELIFTHPDARKILSKMPKEAITKDLVKRLCS
jgi:hypothetical protein